MIYDPVRDRMLVFGGDDHVSAREWTSGRPETSGGIARAGRS
jgi:hypothetical protein